MVPYSKFSTKICVENSVDHLLLSFGGATASGLWDLSSLTKINPECELRWKREMGS